MKSTYQNIQDGCNTAFLDYRTESNLAYRPQFITNDYKSGKKMLTTLEQELRNCDEFFMSVAFITESGITPLLQTLKELERRGVPGKIMTTNYLTFSEPKALMKLASLSNIELKMYCVEEEKAGFHTKGYLFRTEEVYQIIVGSSNMTLSALTKNKEWNTKIVSTKQGEYAKEILNEFYGLWKQAKPLEEWIDTYTKVYEQHRQMLRQTKVASLEQYQLEPNTMQVSFINRLEKLRESGAERALLISATGTGKTYASAFALRTINPKKALFLVHREQIAKQAKKSYANVFGSTKTMGLLSGNRKDYNADFLFSTVQMMSKADVYEKFAKNEFDVIVIDEVHRAGATGYQKVMEYFKPQLWLGMTASPERTDGYDIYQLFDHNIAYEIRLQDALEENLLCPFHYFGITEITVNGALIDDATEFSYLVSDERVNHIISQAEYFSYCGDRVHGLVFCRSKKEAEELSNAFNKRGYQTIALSGDNSQQQREEAIEKLEQENRNGGYDYIFTVDIFNEGVDIPCVNQVIMLRPTESAIVFVQQLGRGLRKSDEKEYVVILDFIGNYEKNFLIPIALSGDRTFNKDTIRKYVQEGNRVIPGSSTIHFDEIVTKRIYESINQTNFASIRFLKEKYLELKYKLGRIPTLLDFYQNGSVDASIIFEKMKSYYTFLKKMDNEYKASLTGHQLLMVEFVSMQLANGKRPHELLLLQMLMNQESVSILNYRDALKKRYGIEADESSVNSALRILSGGFIAGSDKIKYGDCKFVDVTRKDGKQNLTIHQQNREDIQEVAIKRTKAYFEGMKSLEYKKQLNDVVEYGLRVYEDQFQQRYEDTNLCLYEKYSRKDVCRILNWESDESSTVYGYKIKHNTCIIFVTYNKEDDISDSTKYEDQFVDQCTFSWMTRNRVGWHSKEPQAIFNHKELGLDIHLFVKKADGEGRDFYYLGKVDPVIEESHETTIKNDKGDVLPIVNIIYRLNQPVKEDVYDYLIK
ncbi:DNA/RNA helicase of DEAD/DEAH box family [Lachnospiraceae bacterium KM106-2]|nr:DNA/RNA helicase of DEAD/DEAH box family [Lachnospiraceae bacterium KM106-2]